MNRASLAACIISSLLVAPVLAEAPTTSPAGAPTTQPQAVEKITLEQFDALRSQPGQVVLDVRTPREFASGHVPGAINVPSGKGFDEAISQLDKSKPYLVYCHSGKRSFLTTQRMRASGFEQLRNFPGGIVAWEEAGKPMETGKANGPKPAK